MGKLILTSGGYLDGQRSDELDKLIFKYSNDKKVLLVQNATTTGSNVKGINNIKNNFKSIKAVIDVLTLNKDNLNLIFNYDVIYITGGDLAPLIELANNNDFSTHILKHLNKGGVIIGESSGSMIFAKDLKWCYDINKGKKPKYDTILPTYKGLGLTNLNIFPHWNKVDDLYKQKTINYEKTTGIKIFRMQDGEFEIIEI